MSARDAGIRLTVYRIDPVAGRRHTVRPARTYTGDERALYPLTALWPPWRCHSAHETVKSFTTV
jgi:hypothetical protein